MKALVGLSVVLCLGVGLVGLDFWLIDGLDGWLWGLAMKEDTVYTAGYTDSGFRQVRCGMSEGEVHRLLGPPQARWSIPVDQSGIDAGERWSFSPGDMSFRHRVVLFRR